MTELARKPAPQPIERAGAGGLRSQIQWFINLRWSAAASLVAVALLDHFWLHWFEHSSRLLTVGAVILAYNVVLRATLHGLQKHRARSRPLLLLAWSQLLLDMSCLTLLTLWTGGVASPLLALFVFHMVFASILLPRSMAYAAAGAALALVSSALLLSDGWPNTRRDSLTLLVWIFLLLMTTHLANHITRGLRRQRRRLIRQNRRISAMARRLRRHQQALVQHEKMVAMGQMAAGVTHEIANPLASMDSLLQLMQRKPDRPRPESIETLREQVQRIHEIIQQMKEFAHPAAQGQWETVPLNDLLETSLGMVRFDSRLKRAQVERHFANDAGTLTCLPRAVQQVMVNLIINSLDAMADVPQPTLVVRTAREQDWCVIEVMDNGPGIPAEHLDRLFEPFFTTKPVGKGTGLGLSISYSLIKKHGGSISAHNRIGGAGGAVFTIRLPINPKHSQPREKAGEVISGSENPAS
jgi:signal transduction histidine kinase